MRIEIACFSENGLALGESLRHGLATRGDAVAVCRCGGGSGVAVAEWTAQRFSAADALIFIGAVGIAVRAIAPHLRSKLTDPAVVAVDEKGCFAVSVLSGHIGGANGLAHAVARILSATPVITTATDVNQLFAIDSWAVRHGFAIINPQRVKTTTAAYLAGEVMKIYTDLPVVGPMPERVEVVPLDNEIDDASIATGAVIDIRDLHGDRLQLVPPMAALGVGCRRGTTADALRQAFSSLCDTIGIHRQAVGMVASIDLKKDEAGLVEFAAGLGLPLTTYPARRLAEVPGVFSSSAFVEQTAGVDNVCERAAVLAAGGGELFATKTVFPGITMALALTRLQLDFSA